MGWVLVPLFMHTEFLLRRLCSCVNFARFIGLIRLCANFRLTYYRSSSYLMVLVLIEALIFMDGGLFR